MAESVVSFAAETIGKLLINKAKFLWGVEGKVDELQRELKVIRGFLRDADAKREHNDAIAECVAQLREIAYDAEDVIERYILRVAPKKEQNIIKAYVCFVAKFKWVQAHMVGTEIDGFKSSISNLRTNMRDYGIEKMNEDESKRPRASMLRQNFAHFEEDFVGREDNVRELVELLEVGRRERVISIWGMGGLGKTSLAKKVITRDEIKNNFNVAWACVSQEYHVKDILVEILVKLIPDRTKEVKEMTDGQLFEALFNIQKEKRCMVVLDDIWTKEAWDRLQPAFPVKDTRSKLLITTRDKKVAEHIDPHGYIHKLQCLTNQESWDLLMKWAFPQMKSNVASQAVEGTKKQSESEGQLPEITENMKMLGDKLLEKCGGLPLAIIVLGGLLAVNEWEMVHKKFNRHLGEKRDILKVLALSYDDLPWYLKPCFLYLGSFPEDAEIPATNVLHMWIAEGFVSLSACEEAEGAQVEDEAKEYLMELVNRGMVQERLSRSGLIKTYHLHDLMRDLCVSKAMQEGFLSTLPFKLDGETHDRSISMAIKVEPSHKVRRLSLNMHMSAERYVFLNGKPTGRAMAHLRTFMFSRFYPEKWKQSQYILNHCKFLRVLKLEDLESENLLDSDGDLVHLRFLSLARSLFDSLPKSMGNLVLLEYLNLNLASSWTLVPNVLWQMRKLRYLHLPIFFDIQEKLRLNTLKNLRTLRNFSRDNCDVKDIDKLTNLQKLTVVEDNQLEIIPQLAELKLANLRSLSFLFRSHDPFTQDELNKMSKYPYSYKIFIYGKIEKLPELGSLPQQLRKLVLMDFKLREDPMPILEKLEHLVVLMLADGKFNCKEMVCSPGGFPQLKHLFLCWMYRVENLIVEKGGMPKLSRLGLCSCPILEVSIRPGVDIHYCKDDALKALHKSRWLWVHQE